MFVDPDRTGADAGQVLPDLATVDARADPHLITAAARTAASIELRICTQIAAFDVAAEQWFPAAAGFIVTVIVRTVDAATGESRYLPRAEPDEWVRTIFTTGEATGGYFLGAVDPDTGVHRHGQFAYRGRSRRRRHPGAQAQQLQADPRLGGLSRATKSPHADAFPPRWSRRSRMPTDTLNHLRT